jgi:FlaA1/EpsC-like NDP-sugar epimerase
VIRIFYKQIKNEKEVKVTDLKMKRFFIDINDILKRIEFIFKNAK